MELEEKLKLHQPYQRLDYTIRRGDNSMYVRVRFLILLHKNERINIPDGIFVDKDNFFQKTFFVSGEATGKKTLVEKEYFIRFIKNVQTGPAEPHKKDMFKDEIEHRLDGQIFTVRTRIKKQFDITNVDARDPMDTIFFSDPPSDPDEGEGDVTNTTGGGDTVEDERDIGESGDG